MLQVCVSWISFLIPSHAIPGRTTLLVTLFLVLTGFFDNIQATTPHSLGLTALTSYVLTCLAFVFFAMCVFAFLLLRDRVANSKAAALSAAITNNPESVYRPNTVAPAPANNAPVQRERGGAVETLANGVNGINGIHKMARVVEEVNKQPSTYFLVPMYNALN